MVMCRKGEGGVGQGREELQRPGTSGGSRTSRALRLVSPRRDRRQLWAPLVGGDLR